MLLTFKVIVVITVNCYALPQTFTKQLSVLINCHTQGNQPHAMYTLTLHKYLWLTLFFFSLINIGQLLCTRKHYARDRLNKMIPSVN